MNRINITLENAAVYFESLDQAALNHWWSRSIERVERRWCQKELALKYSHSSLGIDWLDVGAGTGSRFRQWSDWGIWSKRVGVEPEPSAISRADLTADFSYEIIQDSLPGMAKVSGEFHFVTAFDVIQHVPRKNRETAIHALVQRVLPSGFLLIRTNAPGLFANTEVDQSLVDSTWLCSTLSEMGMTIVRYSHFNMVGSLAEDLMNSYFKEKRRDEERRLPLKSGLPRQWQNSRNGHPLARLTGWLESQILATGLVKFPVGHSYLVLARKDGNHE